DFLPDAQIRRPSPGIIGRMRAALVFGQLEQRCVPGVGTQARRGIDGNSEIVADFRPGNAFGLILVVARRPLSRRIALGEGRNTGESGCPQEQKTGTPKFFHGETPFRPEYKSNISSAAASIVHGWVREIAEIPLC